MATEWSLLIDAKIYVTQVEEIVINFQLYCRENLIYILIIKSEKARENISQKDKAGK